MVTKRDIETKLAIEATKSDEISGLQKWMETHGPPPDIVQMVQRLNRVKKTTQRVYGSYAVEMAIEAAYYFGRLSLTCCECGDSIPPNEAYCDCWRDKLAEVTKAAQRLNVLFSKQDGIWCPRCGEVFHDEDMTKEPDEYYQCPECGAIQHQKCRGPL